ncbi:MAG TPA: penicillin acylase family protein [Terriglobales bacterium]|nr:penicillin acylase family protein [Terriglobales bacterium]
MVSPSLSVSSPHKGSTSLRVAAVVILLLAVVAVAAAGWFYHLAQAALPQLDGKIFAAGLSASVTVTRDAHGVPTIEAASLEDLFFAQGYVTAQDRLWEMDATRRYASGDMAEIFGPSWVAHDKEQRTLLLRATAESEIAKLAPDELSRLEAYAKGVNAFIATHRDRLPVEFRILGYSPAPWTPADSLVIGAHMIQLLNHYSYKAALTREKILAKLGPELTADLYVNSSWRDHPPGQDSVRWEVPAKGSNESPSSRFGTDVLLGGGPRVDEEMFEPLAAGSNDWVVSGAHTASGKPLLSNDMHLPHRMPNLWYEAHLKSGKFDVAGITLPGTPYVLVGHNQRVAWGFTNLGPTVEDVYIENFDAQGQYQTPDGFRDPERRHEIIHVKGKPDVAFDVLSTRHGPVITDLVPGETRKLALKWTMYDSLHIPFFAVDSAQNWDEFQRAFSAFDAPGQNVVYADADGHIGYHATGRIPIRAAGDGSLPVSGADNAHEWTGYVPFDQLPSAFDPPSGILATANGRITADGYKYSISTEWGSPYRTDRIYHVLQSGKKFTPADMLALQTDVYSEFDRFCAERFVYALDHAKSASLRARQARDLMRDWDGRVTVDSAAANVVTASRAQLVRLLLEPKLGAARSTSDNDTEPDQLNWKDYNWFMSSVWLENTLVHQPARWLPSNFKNYDELLAAAVEAAVSHAGVPGDLATWKWGHAHPVEIQHPILGSIPFLRRWTGPGKHDQSGDGYTVKQVGRTFGPSERMTVDFSDLDQSTLNTVTGQGGNLFSPYYMDQWPAWYNGTTFTLPFTAAGVEKSRAHQLVLEPAR